MMRYATILLFVALTGCSCFTHGPESKEPGLGAVQNFAVIEEGKLYRGARPSSKAIVQLRERLKIRSIINLDPVHDDCAAVAGLKYFYFPSRARASDKNARQVMQFLKTAADPANHPIFLHCNRGADRTGEFIAAYRVVVQNRELPAVYDEMDRHLFCDWQFKPLKSYVRYLYANRAEVLQQLQSMNPPSPTSCDAP